MNKEIPLMIIVGGIAGILNVGLIAGFLWGCALTRYMWLKEVNE